MLRALNNSKLIGRIIRDLERHASMDGKMANGKKVQFISDYEISTYLMFVNPYGRIYSAGLIETQHN